MVTVVGLAVVAVLASTRQRSASPARHVARPTTIVVRRGEANGIPWTLKAYRNASGRLCVAFTEGGVSSLSTSGAKACGENVRGAPGLRHVGAAHSFALLGTLGGARSQRFPDFVAGPTAADVRRIDIVQSAGFPLHISTFAPPPSLDVALRFFVGFLPAGMKPQALVARSSNGRVLEDLFLPSSLPRSAIPHGPHGPTQVVTNVAVGY